MYSILHHVSEESLDVNYKHLHHADSLKLLEKARLSLLTTIGYSAEALIERGLYPVIWSIEINYLREVKAGDFVVTCEGMEPSGRSLIIHQKLINDRQKVAVQAKVTSMLFEKTHGRAVTPPIELLRIFENLSCLDS